MSERLSLSHADFELDIAPLAGGGIALLNWQGLPLLRPAVEGGVAARDPLGLSCFPMTPYVSRITDGVFSWGDVTTKIAPNMAGGAHPLHGIGWRKPWDIVHQTSDQVVLELIHNGDDDWPWAFSTQQEFHLSDKAFTHILSVRSNDSRPFPTSLGPHPYFLSKDATIQFTSDALWEISGESLPTQKARPSVVDTLAKGAVATSLDLDHCFEDWDGRARITWPNHGVDISATIHLDEVESPCTRLQLYTPKDAGFFCFEPVTARCVSFSEPNPEIHGVVELGQKEMAIKTVIKPFFVNAV
jgi:aldose 1-epimerase